MKNLKYKIYTLGCKVNQYDSAQLRSRLREIGFAGADGDADLVIINTCAVTKAAIHKARRMIKVARSENERARFILAGCWPKVYGSGEMPDGFDLVCGTNEIERIISSVKEIFDVSKFHSHQDFLSETSRTRYFLKIQDGCEQFCAYCVIPYARGPLKTRSKKEVMAEFEAAIRAGYKEIILCGIHLGLYGKDKPEEGSLNSLLRDLVPVLGEGRIRLSSIELNEVDDELIDLIAGSNGKICRHLHIPLQSGDDEILRAMNRPYNTKYFRERVEKIRSKMPDVALTTDVIVGFPGETDEHFTNVFNFVQEMNFSKVHVFSFSAHEKAPVFHLPNHVDGLAIKKRSENLRKLSADMEKDFRAKFAGRKLKVLVEQPTKKGQMGKTEFYFDVELSGEGFIDRVGGIVKVVV